MTEWRPNDIPVEVPPQEDGGYSGPTDYEIPEDAITEATDNDDVNAATAEAETAVDEVAIAAPDDWTAYDGDAPRAESKAGNTDTKTDDRPVMIISNGPSFDSDDKKAVTRGTDKSGKTADGTEQKPNTDGTEQQASADGTEQTAHNERKTEDSDTTSGADETDDQSTDGKHAADETKQEPDNTNAETNDSGDQGRHRADQQASPDTQTTDVKVNPIFASTLLEAFEPEPESKDAKAKGADAEADNARNPEEDLTIGEVAAEIAADIVVGAVKSLLGIKGDEAGTDAKTTDGAKHAAETEPAPADTTPNLPEDTAATAQAETEAAEAAKSDDTLSRQQAEADATAASETEQARHRAAEPEVAPPAPEPVRAAEPEVEPAATDQPVPEAAPTQETHTEATPDNSPATEAEEAADAEAAAPRWHDGVDLDAASNGGTSTSDSDRTETDKLSTTETARTTAEEGSDRADYLGSTATGDVVAPTEASDGPISGEIVGGTDASAESSNTSGAPMEGMASFVGEAFADVQGATAVSPNTSADPNGGFVPTAGNPTENYPDGLPSPDGGVPMPPRPDLEGMGGAEQVFGEGGGSEGGESTGGGSDAYSGPALHENPDQQRTAAQDQQRQQQQTATAPHPEAQRFGDARDNVKPESTAARVAKTVAGAVGRGIVKGTVGTVVTGAASAAATVGMLGTHIGKNAVVRTGLGTYAIKVTSNGQTKTIEVHAPNEFFARIAARYKASFATN